MEETRGRAFLLISLIALSVLAILPPPLPHPVSASAPPNQFSAERAMAHVEVIARTPHSVGSRPHTEVEDYLVEQIRSLGLQPEVQAGTGVSYVRTTLLAAPVRNILVRLPGKIHSDPVMLVGHYDSKLAAPGASDDGHAIAVLLETLRALQHEPPPRHDLIFLMTDGEEVDLLGAGVFVRSHPWKSEPSLVLNFEARGTGGASQMFETSAGNEKLIRHLAKASPYADAASFAYEVYRRLPNDTDMTVFKRAGMSGMNFAFINHPEFYHTAYDNPAHLDHRSLQQQGEYALSLARHFGNADPDWKGKSDAIFFRPGPLPLIVYPAAWALPLAVLTILALCGAVILVARSDGLHWRGVSFALLVFPFWLVAVATANAGLFSLIRAVDSAYSTFAYGFTYNQSWYGASALFLTLGLSTACLTPFAKKGWLRELVIACLVWQVPLLLLATVAAPGASYLLQWPLLFGAVSYLLLCRGSGSLPSVSRPAFLVTAALLALPALVLLGATIKAGFTGLGLGGLPALMVFTTLLLAFLLPQLAQIIRAAVHPRAWWIAASLILVSTALFCAALLRPGFDAAHPRQVQVSYFVDSGTGRASWVALPHSLSTFERRYFGGSPSRAELPQLIPPLYGRMRVLQRDAPFSSMPIPDIKLVEDRSAGSERRLQLHVSPRRQAYAVLLWAESATLQAASVEGGVWMPESSAKEQMKKPISLLAFYGFPESGFNLSLAVKDNTPFKLHEVVISGGLPSLDGFPSHLTDPALMPAQERPPLFPAFSTITSQTVLL